MMLSYSVGLTSGSIVAYLLDMAIGSHPVHFCNDFSLQNTTIYNEATAQTTAAFITATTQSAYTNPVTL